jgi:acid phosphatase
MIAGGVMVALAACSSPAASPVAPAAPQATSTVSRPPASGAAAPGSLFNHVVIVLEENSTYEDVIGAASAPYLNSLAAQYSVATQYYANTHPSIGNYFMLTVGEIITNNSNHSGIVRHDNIVRQLLAAGKTWKSYAEDLPSVGYTGGDTGGYARRHNVFALISDVVENAAQVMNLVPFSQFATDLATDALPNFAFIVPNLCHIAHDCPLSTADAWLQANMAALLSSSRFQQDGLLIILFDEAAEADQRYGGGRVAWVAVSAKSKPGYRSTTVYQHQSTLRLAAEALGLTVLPNQAAFAPAMDEFFIR